jgi:flagellar motor protein MotB
VSTLTYELEEDESHDTWPAFVDLFAATSLLFITSSACSCSSRAVQDAAARSTRARLIARLDSVSRGGQLYTIDRDDPQFVRIILRERATFPAGAVPVGGAAHRGKDALQAIGGVLEDTVLRELYREVRVLGPQRSGAYAYGGFTNWELSASRAAVVARYLVNWGG